MLKVLHFKFTALLGRYPLDEIRRLFREQGIDFITGSQIPKGIWQFEKLLEYCREQNIDWLYWGWEKEDTELYKKVFEAPRKFKILMFAQEQAQALETLRKNSKYADFVITSSPVYRNEVDGFLPFGIHTYYFLDKKLPFNQKQNRILISGSYRHSRGQFFEWALREQPFKWPVYLFCPDLTKNLVEKDRMRQIVSRYPKYVYSCAKGIEGYIPKLLQHLNTHKLFLDFTTNSSNYLKFHEDLEVLLRDAKKYKGGYCPERILDALWLGVYSFCFEDEAIKKVLHNCVSYYSLLSDLVNQVNAIIENQELLENRATLAQGYVERYTTEKVIKALAYIFKTGRMFEL